MKAYLHKIPSFTLLPSFTLILTYTLKLFSILSLFSFLLIANSVAAEEVDFEETKRFMEYDVIIDVGHGGVDGGTFYQNLLEKELNLQIGTKLYMQLKENGYRVGITRLKDYALSDDSPYFWIRSRHLKDLRQRRLIAETLKPKVFISIHINFSPNKHIKGPIILHQKQAESYLLAELLQEELNQLTKVSKRPKQTHHYYLLEKLTQPCLIAEVGYISHAIERSKLSQAEYQNKIAEHMTKAIDQYFLLYP